MPSLRFRLAQGDPKCGTMIVNNDTGKKVLSYECDVCKRETSACVRCKACDLILYCGTDCQARDAARHAKHCKPPPAKKAKNARI